VPILILIISSPSLISHLNNLPAIEKIPLLESDFVKCLVFKVFIFALCRQPKCLEFEDNTFFKCYKSALQTSLGLGWVLGYVSYVEKPLLRINLTVL
jgi:hypothetical protein